MHKILKLGARAIVSDSSLIYTNIIYSAVSFIPSKNQIVKRSILTLLCLTFGIDSFGQKQVIDSISTLSYYELDTYFYKHSVDTVQDQLHGKAYLTKAKREKDDERMAYAYYHLAKSSSTRDAILYCDSSILYSQELYKHEFLPAAPYTFKATTYFGLREYEKALDGYLSALFYAKRGGDKLTELQVRTNLASLQMITLNYEGAIKGYIEYLDFVAENNFERADVLLYQALYQLANAYFRIERLDAADSVINIGHELAMNANDVTILAYYRVLSGANAYKKGDYAIAMDSLLKGQSLLDDNYVRLDEFNTYVNLYLGKSQLKLENEDIGIDYLKQVDNYVQEVLPTEYDFLAIYELLIAHYKEKGDLDQQLKYVNHYIKADSVFRTKQGILKNSINFGFEISDIYDQRDELIKRLERKNERNRRYLFILILVAGTALMILLYFMRLNRINQKKFRAILSQLEEEKREQEFLESDAKANRTNKTELSVDVINEILRKLDAFEEEGQFLENHTLPTLAKALNTNGTYLSKVINTYKSTNFSNYLSELRIKYSIKRLHEDHKFRMYTIEAVAKESGYNTAQSFSKAFQKKTGLKPSYFIQQLNAQKE